MSPALLRIVTRLRSLRQQLERVKVDKEAAQRWLDRAQSAWDKAPNSTTKDHLTKAMYELKSHADAAASLEQEIARLAAEEAQLLREAAQKASELSRGAQGGRLWRLATWVGQRVGMGAGTGALIVIVVAGAATYGAANAAGWMAADSSVAYGEKVTRRPPGERFTSETRVPDAPATIHSTYRWVRTKITKQVAGVRFPEEIEVEGPQTSFDLTVDRPSYGSTATLHLKVPTTVKGDKDAIQIDARVTATWALKQGTHNLNAGLSLLGTGAHQALPKTEGGWLDVGSHTLSVEHSKSTSFGADAMVKKWRDPDGRTDHRSITLGFHTGVVQDLSSVNVTLIYDEVW